METMWIENKSKVLMVEAEERTCPRCRGFGGTTADKDGEDCHVCDGHGWAWVSNCGWTLAPGKPPEDSQLY